jgi:penicillin-binding protein 1C
LELLRFLVHLRKHKKKFLILAAVVFLLATMRFSAQWVVFEDPCSTVVFDRHGQLLGARIAGDGQWRFPETGTVPDKYRQCLLLFEDRYFFSHPGVNPFSMLRALYQNLKSRKIKSGGSTITMQVVRLSRKGRPRNVVEKMIEVFLATGLEMKLSKSEILRLYASHAPYGGNVVGLDAAAWRYFGRPAQSLSWAEAATLAVLPNAPALMHPGRNREALGGKRNRLLQKLFDERIIDALTLDLALAEPLPDHPLPLPETAFHITANAELQESEKAVHTTIDEGLQKKCNAILNRHINILKSNGIHNAALIIVDNLTGEILAYIGNHYIRRDDRFGGQVDVVTSPRSGGSILKPLLYAAMLESGEILPGSLVADIPTAVSGYSPKNFSLTYDGAVPANEALIRSLNVPAVRLLQTYGTERFFNKLKNAGISTLDRPAHHYGLSLILGGCEVTLWDMVKIYSGMASQLRLADDSRILRDGASYPEIFWDREEAKIQNHTAAVFDPGAVYAMLEAMTKVKRPAAEAGWEAFAGRQAIAWKTGTSFGFRDAWAIGVTPGYTVGVWVGNADGEGRPGLTGIQSAAPILFEIFGLLPNTGDFIVPHDHLAEVSVCSMSGKRPSPACTQTTEVIAPQAGLESEMCPWHQIIHLDSSENFRVHADCYPQQLIRQKSWFVLPPAMAWYYRYKNPFYQRLPAWNPGCRIQPESPMQLIWPENPNDIFIPLEADGSRGKVVFEIAHHDPSKTVFWYIDDRFAGQTTHHHKMSLQPDPGSYRLVLVDEAGNFLRTGFTITTGN